MASVDAGKLGKIIARGGSMGWNSKYWDILDQLYWSPKYLGLKSIPQRHWRRSDGWISVPEADVNLSGPLYTRLGRASDLKQHLLSQEEILNHLFDLTFAIAPDELIRRAFFEPLGISDSGPFQSLGREIRERFGWGGSANNTQQDGLFVGARAVVGVELKLTTSSSAAQIAKYAALLMWEEIHSGQKSDLGLLYIVPAESLHGLWKNCGLSDAAIDAGYIGRTMEMKLPNEVRRLIDKHPDHWTSILSRMKLGAISWHDLRRCLQNMRDELQPATPGDQTLCRLIAGFLAQLDAHQHTGLD